MVFEEFANKLEQHKQELAVEMAQLVSERQVKGYIENSVTELSRQFVTHFETTIYYIVQYEPTLWRNYYSEVAKRRLQANYSIESILTTSQIFYEILQRFVNQYWPAATQQKLNQKFHQRIQGMQTLSETTIRQVYLSNSYRSR